MIRPRRAMRALLAAGFATAACAQAQAGVAGSAPTAGRGDVARTAGGTGPNTTSGTGAGLRLSVQVSRDFFSPNGVGSTLFSAGKVSPAFSCSNVAEDEGAGVAFESAQNGVRTLQLSHVLPGGDSLLDQFGLGGSWSGNSDPASKIQLWITDARLEVVPLGTGGSNASILHAALDHPLPLGTKMQVPRGMEEPAALTLQYDCWSDGKAVVKLQFQVSGDGLLPETVCLRWIKTCATGWQHIAIKQGKLTVFTDGAVDQLWQGTMLSEGTTDIATKLQIVSTGVQRMRYPTVTSSKPFLKVGVRGPFLGASDTEAFDVSRDPVGFSIFYTCESDGQADVELTFEKAMLDTSHKPEKLKLQWRKICGATVYRHLQVFLKSETYRNSTLAVDSGIALPPFLPPCKLAKALGGESAETPSCQDRTSMFDVPVKDRRTSLELTIAQEGRMEPPSLQPPPDLSYDSKILQAIISLSASGGTGKQRVVNRPFREALNVKYTCFKEGTSVIMVTLHMLAHKPVDIAWLKHCTEPKIHVGKALTAAQAITITFLVVGILAVVCCLIFALCGTDNKSSHMANGGDMDDGEDVELTSADNRTGPLPTKLGSQEVTFH